MSKDAKMITSNDCLIEIIESVDVMLNLYRCDQVLVSAFEFL